MRGTRVKTLRAALRRLLDRPASKSQVRVGKKQWKKTGHRARKG